MNLYEYSSGKRFVNVCDEGMHQLPFLASSVLGISRLVILATAQTKRGRSRVPFIDRARMPMQKTIRNNKASTQDIPRLTKHKTLRHLTPRKKQQQNPPTPTAKSESATGKKICFFRSTE